MRLGIKINHELFVSPGMDSYSQQNVKDETCLCTVFSSLERYLLHKVERIIRILT